MTLASTLALLIILAQLPSAFALKLSFEDKFRKAITLAFPAAEKIEILNLRFPCQPPARATIEAVSTTPPLGFVSVEAKWEGQSAHCPGYATRVYGTAVVRVHQKIASAKTGIGHDEGLNANNVVFSVKELSLFSRSGFFSSLAQVEPLRARGFIAPGSVLGNLNTLLPKPVTQGDTVNLVHEKGSFKLNASVKALQAGNVGQRIQVQNQNSGKIFAAVVSGLREVRIR